MVLSTEEIVWRDTNQQIVQIKWHNKEFLIFLSASFVSAYWKLFSNHTSLLLRSGYSRFTYKKES